MKSYVAVAEIQIDASPARVWSAMTDPAEIGQYMFGSEVVTDWEPGSPIVWRGEYEGKSYEDHGEILEFEPERRLVMTHFSPLNGEDDVPENYHVLAYEVEEVDGETRVRLTQDNNTSPRRPSTRGPTGRKCSQGSSPSSSGVRLAAQARRGTNARQFRAACVREAAVAASRGVAGGRPPRAPHRSRGSALRAR